MPDESFNFLFMADAHIKERTWTNFTQLGGDAYLALSNLPETLPETLVIGGDWYDSNKPTSNDVLQTNRFLARFKTVYYIRGNHDSMIPSFLETASSDIEGSVHVCELSEEPIEMSAKTFIAGVSWSPSLDGLKQSLTVIREQYALLPEGSKLYIILHTSFKHMLAFDESKLTTQELEEQFKDCDVSFLVGHIHVRNFTKLSCSSDSYFLSPGSLYPVSADKMGVSNSVWVISHAPGSKDIVSEIIATVRNYYRLPVYNQQEAIKAIDGIIEEIEKYPRYLRPFIRLLVDEGVTIQVPTASKEQAIIQVVDVKQEATLNHQQQPAIIQISMDDAITEFSADNKLAADLAIALLHTDDPVKLIDDWLKFWKVARTC